MTTDDVKKILVFLRGCYPAFYRNTTPEEMAAIQMAWSTLFSDDYYTYDMVFDAVKQCVTGQLRIYPRDKETGMGTREATDGAYRRFPPQPGVIVEKLEEWRDVTRYVQRFIAENVRCESLPGGCEDGQQNENRVVYAHMEPCHGL